MMEGNIRKITHICVRLSHFAIQWKLEQYYTSTVLSKYKKDNGLMPPPKSGIMGSRPFLRCGGVRVPSETECGFRGN